MSLYEILKGEYFSGYIEMLNELPSGYSVKDEEVIANNKIKTLKISIKLFLNY